jgi:hypothetical protein
MTKISKAAVGYTFHPDVEYPCSTCVFIKPIGTAVFKPDREFAAGCSFFGPQDPISPTKGGCIYYTHGDSTKFDIPWLSLFTKEQLGYEENRNGFGCKRCEYADLPASDCQKVDKDSPGDTPGEIHFGACCGAWERDKVRGKMTTPEILDYLSRLGSKDPAKAESVKEYESRRKAQKESHG